MKPNPKEQFHQSFQAAVKASLQAGCASDAMRNRLMQSLAAQKSSTPPLEEAELHRFETALSQAVAASQDWAVDGSVALQVESALGQESGQDLLSERSAYEASGLDSPKAAYLKAFTGAVRRSQEALVAPAECRQRLQSALAAAASPAPDSQPIVPSRQARSAKVVLLHSRSPWKRALVAVASVAAGFALIFGTLVGGAEKALADSVRQDHQRCCSALKRTTLQRCASYDSSLYGALPKVPIPAEWTLVASRMCHGKDASPMIHNVYFLEGKTISVHFLPPEKSRAAAANTQPRQIADGDFPVMAWETSGWTVTACSSDLDMDTLASIIGAN
jgi:hypothetical protein